MRRHRMRIERLRLGWWCLRYIIPAQILLSVSVMFASDIHASCELAKESILSRPSLGLFQVSNVGPIRMKCSIPKRPFPTKPGEFRNGLRAETTAYEISANGTKTSVPSDVDVVGGGFGPDPEPDWVDFYVNILLDPDEIDAEVSRYLAKLEAAETGEQKEQSKVLHGASAREKLRVLIRQHRTGHFQIECRVLDGTRVMGVDVIELEVLFKGHYADVALPAFPPA
jgi:hypothetical protein